MSKNNKFKKFIPDGFVIGTFLAIIAAYYYPYLGSTESPVPLGKITDIGIIIIFFLYGLKLDPSKIKDDLSNYKLHLLIQTVTFLLFPLVIILFYPLVSTPESKEIWLTFLFLASLPSTVSSAVVMVSIAHGNVPGAIFNASISGLLGVIITPLWMGFFIQRAHTGDYDLQHIYIQLVTNILLPIILGLLLERWFGKYVKENQAILSNFDKAVIVLIIYNSFAESFISGVFNGIPVKYLLKISFLLVILFFAMYYLTGYIARKLKMKQPDIITAQFCGTKKSLVHGTVFATIIFPASISTGIIILPLMLFHTFQIFVLGIIAARYDRAYDLSLTNGAEN